jgi:glucose/arabinose dehydrogenase
MRRTRGRLYRTIALAAACAAVTAGCGDDDGGAGETPGDEQDTASDTTGAGDAGDTDPEAPGTDVPPLADVELRLTEVAEADEPISLVTRPGTDTLYVAEKGGRVRTLAADGALGDPILDISDDVVNDGEQGLLDITFGAVDDSGGDEGGDTLYVSYSVASSGATRVVAYDVDGDTVDQGSQREVLSVEQPFPNHNGGDVEIGPDGHLYVTLGDGGSGGDPIGNGQDTGVLLGKILRIDPAAAAGDDPYGVPADNPFADDPGAGAPEVWLYGVRNPWRIAFDPATDDLWVADVGQNAYEEINLLPADDGAGRGANLGWNEMEGTHPFDGGSNPDGAVLPVFDYGREGGCSVTGGVVYRGAAIPQLDGAYLFADYCAGDLRALRAGGGGTTDEHTYDESVASPVSFGTDADGEVYVLSQDGGIFRIDAG